MSAIIFTHKDVGNLTIDNGIDDVRWGYNLNTSTFPTFGGEVVQILSVYIDDLTLTGTCATYSQIEAIYSYFAAYFQGATQGASGAGSYNLDPITFTYTERNWSFNLYPKSAPGFRYGREVVTPVWHLISHVIDNTPDLALIKDGLKALSSNELPGGPENFQGVNLNTLVLNGEISPGSGNPDTDPWETLTGGKDKAQQLIGNYGTYFNNLLTAYNNNDFSALTGVGTASSPNPKPATSGQAGAALTQPGKPKAGP